MILAVCVGGGVVMFQQAYKGSKKALLNSLIEKDSLITCAS